MRWWRGLDSNQRTLARADLQSAAFNHSATSPDCAGQMASAPQTVNRKAGSLSATLARCAPTQPHATAARVGAGEGNRTLVVSLEGFCSTIELHPRPSGG